MRVKAYLVLIDTQDGGLDIVAVRLTHGAAQAIANATPGAFVERWNATKETTLQTVERVETDAPYLKIANG